MKFAMIRANPRLIPKLLYKQLFVRYFLGRARQRFTQFVKSRKPSTLPPIAPSEPAQRIPGCQLKFIARKILVLRDFE